MEFTTLSCGMIQKNSFHSSAQNPKLLQLYILRYLLSSRNAYGKMCLKNEAKANLVTTLTASDFGLTK